MPHKLKRKLIKLIPLVKPTITVGVFFFLIFIFIRLLYPTFQFIKENNISSSLLFALWNNPGEYFKSFQQRTNVAILGIAGGNYAGNNLTDSIILLSIDFQNKDGVLVSIPRDIWLPSLKDKINSAYHYGEEKKPGGGIPLAKAAVEEVVGIPITYAWVIDFSGFKHLIDSIEGVDVFVEKGFIDDTYPIEGKEDDFCGGDPLFACRYETLQFQPGRQHMNGELALKYSRSRYAEGNEGTDFARSKRQQEIMRAFKDKIISQAIWKNPTKLKILLESFEDMTITDMNWSQRILFFNFFVKLKEENIRHVILDTGKSDKKKTGLLINPPIWQYNGLWVLVPRTNNFNEIHNYISCQLYKSNCESIAL